jgi:hypothetical protein
MYDTPLNLPSSTCPHVSCSTALWWLRCPTHHSFITLPSLHMFTGARGLLQPLLKRYQARACTAAVFGLPAVQAIISFKWNTWAKR